MAQQTINIGASPNDGTGTPLRTSFDYTNQNFTELYTAVGPSGNNIVVPGNATITGALTVDTTTLVVNAAGYADRVGIGTATPNYILDILGAAPRLHIKDNATNSSLVDIENGAGTLYVGRENSTGSGGLSGVPYAGIMYLQGAYPLIFGTNFVERYRIGSTGISTWSVAGTTAMTLDSTGLGIGASPATDSRITIGSTNATGFQYALRTTGITTGRTQIYLTNTSGDFIAGVESTPVGPAISGATANCGYAGTSTSNPFYLVTNSVVRATVDSTGNVGIGVVPSAWRTSVPFKALQIGYTGTVYALGATEQVNLSSNYLQDTAGNEVRIQAGYATRYQQSSGQHLWSIAGTSTAGSGITFTQAMTLTATGEFLVGTTSTSVTNGGVVTYGTSVGQLALGHATGTTSGNAYAGFQYAGTQIGSITQSGTTGVLFNITSDYRLKESVKPISGGLARVNALKPSIYNWKSDGSTGEGFLAHELAEVVPAAVSGDKDAMNADGTIKSQGIDMSRIVPILVAAIQELTAEVNALKNA